MGYFFFVILITFYFSLVGIALYRFIGKSDESYLLWLIILLFPVYTHVLSITYAVTESKMLVNVIRASKDLIFFSAILSFFLFQRNPLIQRYRFVTLDYLFLAFYGLTLLYLVLPFGEASFFNKAIYFKNMAFMGIAYLLGRNSRMDFNGMINVGKVIIWIVFIAFIVGLSEKLTNSHLHTFTGYGSYHQEILNINPGGSYGLTWTFEASDGTKRFGSIFSNPLEYAASMLMAAAVVFLFYIKSTFSTNRHFYLLSGLIVLLNVFFAYSRSSMVAMLLVIMFIAYHQRYYKLIAAVIFSFLAAVFYILNIAEDDTKYFFIDTVLFQESSALGHVVEWAAAIESMVENPAGIGLATSGNASGVEDDLHVGGENQFLIYGVQLGFAGLFIYLCMTLVVIKRGFKISRNRLPLAVMFAPFVASVTRFGLLLPMMTANAELYAFVSLTSWFLAGYAMRNVQ